MSILHQTSNCLPHPVGLSGQCPLTICDQLNAAPSESNVEEKGERWPLDWPAETVPDARPPRHLRYLAGRLMRYFVSAGI